MPISAERMRDFRVRHEAKTQSFRLVEDVLEVEKPSSGFSKDVAELYGLKQTLKAMTDKFEAEHEKRMDDLTQRILAALKQANHRLVKVQNMVVDVQRVERVRTDWKKVFDMALASFVGKARKMLLAFKEELTHGDSPYLIFTPKREGVMGDVTGSITRHVTAFFNRVLAMFADQDESYQELERAFLHLHN